MVLKIVNISSLYMLGWIAPTISNLEIGLCVSNTLDVYSKKMLLVSKNKIRWNSYLTYEYDMAIYTRQSSCDKKNIKRINKIVPHIIIVDNAFIDMNEKYSIPNTIPSTKFMSTDYLITIKYYYPRIDIVIDDLKDYRDSNEAILKVKINKKDIKLSYRLAYLLFEYSVEHICKSLDLRSVSGLIMVKVMGWLLKDLADDGKIQRSNLQIDHSNVGWEQKVDNFNNSSIETNFTELIKLGKFHQM